MLSKRKSSTINWTSTTKVNEIETIVMSMNATFQEDGGISINQHIQNRELYLANKAEAEADRAEFMADIASMMEE